MNLSLILALILVGTSANAQTAPRSLFDYAVYAKDTITAECSDYLGRTAAGGSVSLRDFLIQMDAGQSGCALESNTRVDLVRGQIAVGTNVSCVAAPNFSNTDAAVGPWYRAQAPFASLSQQMDTLSATLSHPIANTGVKQITLNMARVQASHTIALSGSANGLLVVNVLETDVSFYNYGVVLTGGLTAQNIIWNFPNTKTLFIAYSGMNNYGMPGTFVAPQAQVTFNNARITGALFAKSIIGKADKADCSGVVSGQVNGACLLDIVPGIGCTTCGNGQHQNPPRSL
jgi:hypothetical protein